MSRFLAFHSLAEYIRVPLHAAKGASLEVASQNHLGTVSFEALRALVAYKPTLPETCSGA